MIFAAQADAANPITVIIANRTAINPAQTRRFLNRFVKFLHILSTIRGYAHHRTTKPPQNPHRTPATPLNPIPAFSSSFLGATSPIPFFVRNVTFVNQSSATRSHYIFNTMPKKAIFSVWLGKYGIEDTTGTQDADPPSRFSRSARFDPAGFTALADAIRGKRKKRVRNRTRLRVSYTCDDLSVGAWVQSAPTIGRAETA